MHCRAGAAAGGAHAGAEHSDESDAEVDEADYSVYECPGLAPVGYTHAWPHTHTHLQTGDIEVANPMFTGQSSAAPAKQQSK